MSRFTRLSATGTILATLLVQLAASPAAEAVSVDAPTAFRNVGTGLCLAGNDRGDVYAVGCTGSSYQQWAQQ
ncbi:hypothetical protein AGRA3207_005354 [Actinomadura graeca]|uniref:Ricin B lectin domain-containing protein n=1 Tax=Actinomadura graeca TaxID=2750812 RepID=A0ABX8QZ27_9ACTN|nr:hypothetical protein [Actinomadura graeca]QXJ24100.1 hypothetical protein AGRA3207_005354 [Actinomadura graeca]